MSERSRRRRRRRRPGAGTAGGAEGQRRTERETPEGQPVAREQASAVGRSRRRRRGRSRTGQERTASPKSSEDLVRALPRERPATLTAPPDGQTLEGLIGELQSEYGVPQYPQEYRITVKVADERDRGERTSEEPAARVAPPPNPPVPGAPRREKAPSMSSATGERSGDQAEGAPPRKRSRRRRRRRGGGGAGSAPSA